ITFWPTVTVCCDGSNLMFFMSMSTVPPDSVAAVLVPTGAWVAGAGLLDEDLSSDEPHPAAKRVTRVAARTAIRVMSGTLHLQLHEHGGVVGEWTPLENARLADGLEAPGQHVVDAVPAGPRESGDDARVAHVEVPAEHHRSVGGPGQDAARGLGDVGACALVGV